MIDIVSDTSILDKASFNFRGSYPYFNFLTSDDIMDGVIYPVHTLWFIFDPFDDARCL